MVIQNQDRIVRPTEYDQFTGKLLVTSYFYTLQGEAPFAGYPAVFLRLAGCNFGNKSPNSQCGFCDTNFKFDEGIAIPYAEIMHRLERTRKSKDAILVITGGEPTLQHNLIEFIQKYAQKEFNTIQIETNGTQASFFRKLRTLYDSQAIVDPMSIEEAGLHIVCSPKGLYKIGKLPPVSQTVLDCVHYLKFVIEDREGSPHLTVPDWAFETKLPLYVSPIAVYKKPYAGEVSSIWDTELIDHEQTSKNYRYAAQYCMEHGTRLSVQSHLFTSIA